MNRKEINSDLYQAMMRYILQHRLLDRGDRVLVAVSGGVDSIVLLHLLRRLSVDWSLDIAAAHIHHQLRGREADEDEQFVRRTCQAWIIPFFSARIQVRRHQRENQISLETAAREKRHGRLIEFARRTGSQRIAMGHHAGDQAETVLQHLLRGAGVAGLRGMPVQRGILIRPLLFARREEIVRYARSHKLSWREDRSNVLPDFQRNRIRHGLLPLLQQEYNPQIERTLLRLGTTMEEVHRYLENQAEEALRGCVFEQDRDKIILEIEPFLLYFTILQKYILRLALRHLREDERLLDQDTWTAIFQYLRARETRSPLPLSETCEIWRWRNRLVLFRFFPSVEATLALPESGRRQLSADRRIEIKRVTARLNEIKNNRDANIAWVDAGKLRPPMLVRPFRPGDRFQPLGMARMKKVSDFLHDSQTPNFIRRHLTVLESGGRIVWLCGQRLDDRFKVSETSSNVYRLKWLGNEI